MAYGKFELLAIPSTSSVAILLEDANGVLLAAPQTAASWDAALDVVKTLVSQVGTPNKAVIEVYTA